MQIPTSKKPLVSPGDGNEYHKTFLRQIAGRWEPDGAQEAQAFAEECLARAQCMASIFTQYCWGDRASVEDLKSGLEVIDDLLCLGYSMMEWLTEQALIKEGWTPPNGQEVQP